MVPTLLVLSAGLVMFSAIALIVRKVHTGQASDYLPPQVMTRINTEYSELPQ